MKKTCKNCGRFIEENNEFCIDCLKAMDRKNTNQIVYKTIVDEWRLEAKDEESKYFY